MKIDKTLIFSFCAPLMIIISAIGLISRRDNKRILYLPVGIMGISMILEKEVSRKLKRKNILNKIKSYQKVK
tara:strand:+ start:620 stop:835 length:216 start_codon:yes stop_codon:yes gene_type:complete